MESAARPIPISGLEGHRLGPYDLLDLIGRGGMAIVYKALQPTLRRYVAIKVLPPSFVHEEGFLRRFQQEAEVVAQLEHPNILPIYDYGQEGNIPYIVMPLVSGGTLYDWLGQSRPLNQAVQVFSRLLSALEYAHTHRVVHRDIKPSNVLMREDDWPLLTDFGIAKIVEPSARATRTGTMIGTPEYMSPEQTEGTGVDHRADIYAMGVMLFEVLTGRLPYQASSPMAVLIKHLNEDVPSPSTFNPQLSPVWDTVIRRAMAKHPNDRYATAREMDQAIQEAWRQAGGGHAQTRQTGAVTAAHLYASATRALEREDWPRVVSLCAKILELEPDHVAAVQLLAQARDALRPGASAERPVASPSNGTPPASDERTRVTPSRERTAAPAPVADANAPTAPAAAAAPPPAPAVPATPAAPAPLVAPETPATPAVAAMPVAPLPVVARREGPGRGHGRKLALLGGLAALALVAFASAQFLGGRPSVTTPAAAEAHLASAPVQQPVVVEPEAVAVAPPAPSAAELFPACESAVAASAWADAAAACERVRDLDDAYPGLGPALAASYVGLGKDKLALGGPLPVALDYFHKALAVKSDDAEAEQQRLWAREYQAGEAALAAANWPAATQQLEQLYADAPDYLASAADGGVRPKLYTAAASWGDALLQAGQYTAARERCEQALAVQPDGAEANACQVTAMAALAPPAAPAVAAAPAPVAAPAAGTGAAGGATNASRGSAPAPPVAASKPPAPAPAPAPAAPRAPAGSSSGEKPIFIPQR